MNDTSKKKYIPTPEMLGQRLDKALSVLPEVNSRNRAQDLLEKKCVYINGTFQKPSYKLMLNDVIEVIWPQKIELKITPMNFALDIVFEDEDLLVINKPAGLVVHPAAGHQADTLVNALAFHNSYFNMKFSESRPGIVHRIDKDTSGLLVVAKNDKAHEFLSLQFKKKTIHRRYYAVVLGTVLKKNGILQSYLHRHPVHRKIFCSVRSSTNKIYTEFSADQKIGKWAVTEYTVQSQKNSLSYISLKLQTGRTHQIRVHLSELGHPIVGDSAYGFTKNLAKISNKEIKQDAPKLNRFFLHAAELGFIHPVSQEHLLFKVDWPTADKQQISKWGLI
ncbi:MAG: RluA family pseudouridine synthase [Pseudobdellovibrionaceae bacterium]